MTAGEWIAFAGVMLAAIGGGFTAWNSLRNEIRDSRHKVVSDLMARFQELDGDVDDLKQRVTRLEAKAGAD